MLNLIKQVKATIARKKDINFASKIILYKFTLNKYNKDRKIIVIDLTLLII